MPLLLNLYARFLHYSNALRPVMLLAIRLWIARIFFVSGVLKLLDWGNTIYLFTNEFQVPLLPPQVAAVMGATFELTCPVLLTLGLASRAATLPLLAMTAVINFTYDNNMEHYYWAMLLGVILTSGAGKLSLDHLITMRYKKD